MSTRYTGIEGEDMAAGYLVGIGAEVLDRNVSLAGAEIDIVARIEGVIVFVEVKRRTGTRYGRPAEAVTPAKQRRILRAASLYLAMRSLTDWPVRFEVIELLPGEINHIPGAFDASV